MHLFSWFLIFLLALACHLTIMSAIDVPLALASLLFCSTMWSIKVPDKPLLMFSSLAGTVDTMLILLLVG